MKFEYDTTLGGENWVHYKPSTTDSEKWAGLVNSSSVKKIRLTEDNLSHIFTYPFEASYETAKNKLSNQTNETKCKIILSKTELSECLVSYIKGKYGINASEANINSTNVEVSFKLIAVDKQGTVEV